MIIIDKDNFTIIIQGEFSTSKYKNPFEKRENLITELEEIGFDVVSSEHRIRINKIENVIFFCSGKMTIKQYRKSKKELSNLIDRNDKLWSKNTMDKVIISKNLINLIPDSNNNKNDRSNKNARTKQGTKQRRKLQQ